MVPSQRWLVEVEYPLWDRVQHALKSLPVRVEAMDFATAVNVTLLCREEDMARVWAELTRVTDGRAESLLLEERYAAWEDTAEIGGMPDGSI